MLQLLDLAGLYFRAFHGVPTSTTGPHGRPVNAVRGTLDMITRVVLDARPTRLVACLDLDWRPAWRVELLPSYKAHRVQEAGGGATGGFAPGGADAETVPDELSPQVPVLLDTLRAFGIALAGAEGFEADDVIGTLAGAESTDPVEVVTGDRDLFQLADDGPPGVRVRYVGAGMSRVVVLDAAGVAARHGIPAGRYADFAALRGDPSDGLPGVSGVGDKSAAALVTGFGAVEDIVAAARDPRSAMGAGVRGKILAAVDYLAVAPAVVRVARNAPVRLDPPRSPTPGSAAPDRLPGTPADPGRLAELVREHGLAGPVGRLLTALTP